MILAPPKYTLESNVAAVGPIDEMPETHYPRPEKLMNAIAESAWRARLAIAVGTAEWMLWRLATESDWARPFCFAEAIWAGIVDRRYVFDGKWSTEHPPTVTGAALYEVIRLLVCAWTANERSSVTDISSLVDLARRVLPDKKPFERWLKMVLKRLETHYPMLNYDGELYEEERLPFLDTWRGAPVPREALDPALDYKPEMADELLAAYLAKLDYNENPFLNAPETMLELGFEGTPYTYPAK